MSNQPTVDGFEFAVSGESRQGRWSLHALPRLQSILVETDGHLEYDLRGALDGHGRRALRLRLHGVLKFDCQRCLDTMEFPVDLDAVLVLAASEAEIDADASDPTAPDRILASREMAIGALIEDELLLSIPFAPRHARCTAGRDAGGAQRDSPFANLSAMLGAPAREGRNRSR